MYSISITHNQNPVDEHILKSETVTIGRGTDNDIQLLDTTVSHHHAKLMLMNETLIIEDLGSTNGTYLNGHLVKREYIKQGDIVMIGQHLFSFEKLAEPEETEEQEPTLQMSRNSIEQVIFQNQARPSTPADSKAINWVAQDENGVWWGFERQPVADTAGWSNFQDTMKLKLKQETPNPEWRETLHKI
ncbi:MAG: FHA domain-containing protein [Gammaproteobacteria bacterium]|nr:FHA domain-containing protein [Gammaproteobacteria bacterium]